MAFFFPALLQCASNGADDACFFGKVVFPRRFSAVRPEIARDRHNIHSMYCFLRWAFPYARNFKLMKSNTPPKTKKRIPLVLRTDLIDRLLDKAQTLQQNPNNFVNLCVEGVLDAMDSPGDYKIPILDLYNQVKGKTLLTSKPVMAIVSAFYPEIGDMDEQVQKILMELVGKHEGRLTAEIFKSLRKLATRINMERVDNEREFKKITKQ